MFGVVLQMIFLYPCSRFFLFPEFCLTWAWRTILQIYVVVELYLCPNSI